MKHTDARPTWPHPVHLPPKPRPCKVCLLIHISLLKFLAKAPGGGGGRREENEAEVFEQQKVSGDTSVLGSPAFPHGLTSLEAEAGFLKINETSNTVELAKSVEFSLLTFPPTQSLGRQPCSHRCLALACSHLSTALPRSLPTCGPTAPQGMNSLHPNTC